MRVILTTFTMAIWFCSPAQSQTLADLAEFAQSICADIPDAKISRDSVQEKVAANTGLLAKILTGGGAANSSHAAEIYSGIPFDKLPDKIPTVSMCKTQLVTLLLSHINGNIAGPGGINAPGGINQTGSNATGTIINNYPGFNDIGLPGKPGTSSGGPINK
jgi:hypothetical protein